MYGLQNKYVEAIELQHEEMNPSCFGVKPHVLDERSIRLRVSSSRRYGDVALQWK